jgi:hypothetical protein
MPLRHTSLCRRSLLRRCARAACLSHDKLRPHAARTNCVQNFVRTQADSGRQCHIVAILHRKTSITPERHLCLSEMSESPVGENVVLLNVARGSVSPNVVSGQLPVCRPLVRNVCQVGACAAYSPLRPDMVSQPSSAQGGCDVNSLMRRGVETPTGQS